MDGVRAASTVVVLSADDVQPLPRSPNHHHPRIRRLGHLEKVATEKLFLEAKFFSFRSRSIADLDLGGGGRCAPNDHAMHLNYRPAHTIAALCCACLVMACTGCSLFPDVRHRPSLHNPFPQLKQVAVLPFYNQSNEPTVDGEAVALAYYSELQAIPGFEVIPVGVAQNLLLQYARTFGEPQTGAQFQQLAQFMGVEAVVVGSVTDFDAYYPPRIAMTVHWYAANPGYHPVPPGYGLPWGTKAEKRIPRRIVEETEFELARQQLATQTPTPVSGASAAATEGTIALANHDGEVAADAIAQAPASEMLPAQWPDPTGLIPDPPASSAPTLVAQSKPVLTHTRIYRGDDQYVTNRLSDYVTTDVDGRNGGWQSYLNRSNDFIRFCCHLHLTEMLESRGGLTQSDLILRWPISRY